VAVLSEVKDLYAVAEAISEIAGLKSLGKEEVATQVANLFLFGMRLH